MAATGAGAAAAAAAGGGGGNCCVWNCCECWPKPEEAANDSTSADKAASLSLVAANARPKSATCPCCCGNPELIAATAGGIGFPVASVAMPHRLA